MKKKFGCTGCGACCRRVGQYVERLKKTNLAYLGFPYQWDESGRCEMLNEDNSCAVYDDRPIVCNIQKVIELFDLDQNMVFEQTKQSCNKLIKEDGMSDDYLVK